MPSPLENQENLKSLAESHPPIFFFSVFLPEALIYISEQLKNP